MVGMSVVRVDDKGRVLIPKAVRERVGLRKGGYVRVRVDGKRIVIEAVEPVADRYFGAFKVARWPEDLDDFLVEVVRRRWSRKDTST